MSETIIFHHITNYLDILLRVPPLFIMDFIFLNNTHLSNFIHILQILVDNSTVIADEIEIMSDTNFGYIQTILNNTSSIVRALIFLISLLLFLLPKKNLFEFYKFIFSITTAYLSFFCNNYYNNCELSLFQTGINYLINSIIQVLLLLIFVYLTNIHQTKAIAYFLLGLILLLPYTILSSIIPIGLNHYFPSFNICIFLIYMITLISTKRIQLNSLKLYLSTYRHSFFDLIEVHWQQAHIPEVFRLFWVMRITQQAVWLLMDKAANLDQTTTLMTMLLNGQFLLDCAKYLLIRSCETLIAVMGMTSILSYITHRIGNMVELFLLLDDYDSNRSIGPISAIMFFILAIQNGLTFLEPQVRLIRLYRNCCLLFTALLHFIHNIVNSLLNSLSASHNMSLHRHLRALAVCLMLIVLPYLFLTYLWTHHSISTWLLAVSTFGIEVIVKVIFTLIIYSLFMIDAYSQSSMWEQLDDYVYYVKTVGSLIEFIFGIFLFLNGTWILMFESGGTIRALMMCIHAYFNIWCQGISGLKTFFKRYKVSRKINSLPKALPEQLEKFDDVCSICYQELSTARITRCNHLFHSVCLRQWLYRQDFCPLCHATLFL